MPRRLVNLIAFTSLWGLCTFAPAARGEDCPEVQRQWEHQHKTKKMPPGFGHFLSVIPKAIIFPSGVTDEDCASADAYEEVDDANHRFDRLLVYQCNGTITGGDGTKYDRQNIEDKIAKDVEFFRKNKKLICDAAKKNREAPPPKPDVAKAAPEKPEPKHSPEVEAAAAELEAIGYPLSENKAFCEALAGLLRGADNAKEDELLRRIASEVKDLGPRFVKVWKTYRSLDPKSEDAQALEWSIEMDAGCEG